MPQVVKNFHAQPTSNTDTVIYTCPASTTAVLSNINICNKNATAVTVRVFRRVLGSSPDIYKYFDVTIPNNDTFNRVAGDVMVDTDVLYVRSSATNVDFEISLLENT